MNPNPRRNKRERIDDCPLDSIEAAMLQANAVRAVQNTEKIMDRIDSVVERVQNVERDQLAQKIGLAVLMTVGGVVGFFISNALAIRTLLRSWLS